jgi:dihydrofolate reductase
MARIVVMNHLSLDGVMQAPGRADEDTRGGFNHGGWATPGSDAVVASAVGEQMARGGGLLFGRRTYEDLLTQWNSQPDSPFGPALKRFQVRRLHHAPGTAAVAELDAPSRRRR